MKVVMTSRFHPWHRSSGGGQIAVHEMAKALTLRGHEVHVIYTDENPHKIMVEPPYYSHFVKHQRTLGYIKPVKKKVETLITEERPDIIQGNGPEAYGIKKLSRKTAIPFVMMSHYPSHLTSSLHDFLDYVKFSQTINEVPYKVVTYIEMLMEKRLCELADKVFVPSNFIKEEIIAKYGLARERVVTNYYGVGKRFFEVNRRNADKDRFTLLFVGRLEHQKGVDVLLSSVAELVKEWDDIHLNIIGKGLLQNHYREMTQKLNLEKYVSFLGFVLHNQIVHQYAQSDLFAFPSRYESFGIVVAEAMAVGLPTVTSCEGALPEIVGDAAITVRLNPHEIAKEISLLRRDEDKREILSKRCRERIKKYFTWDITAEKMEKEFDNILVNAPY